MTTKEFIETFSGFAGCGLCRKSHDADRRNLTSHQKVDLIRDYGEHRVRLNLLVRCDGPHVQTIIVLGGEFMPRLRTGGPLVLNGKQSWICDGPTAPRAVRAWIADDFRDAWSAFVIGYAQELQTIIKPNTAAEQPAPM